MCRDATPRWLADALLVLGESQCAAGDRSLGIASRYGKPGLLAKQGGHATPEMLIVPR